MFLFCSFFFYVSVFYLLSSSFPLAYSQPSQTGCLPYFHTWWGLSANLECRSETCCSRLAGNTGCKTSPKSCRLGTIAQLCRAISSHLRHVSTIGKKLFKQPHLLNMYPQYGELRPTSGWDHFVSLEHACKFQRVLRLGSVTAQHSSSGRQPNFAALNRRCRLYSAGQPSRWELAHISSFMYDSVKNTY